MRRLSWILTLPVTVVVVVFAVMNRAPATLDLWPLGVSVRAPLFVVILVSLFVGLLIGGTAAWLSGAKARRRAREARRRAAELERELARARREAPAGGGGAPGAAPAGRAEAQGSGHLPALGA